MKKLSAIIAFSLSAFELYGTNIDSKDWNIMYNYGGSLSFTEYNEMLFEVNDGASGANFAVEYKGALDFSNGFYYTFVMNENIFGTNATAVNVFGFTRDAESGYGISGTEVYGSVSTGTPKISVSFDEYFDYSNFDELTMTVKPAESET